MSNTDVAPVDEPLVNVPVENNEPISLRQAADEISRFREKQEQPESADEPAAQEELPPEGDAAPAEEATSDEPTEEAEPEQLPPIEPPRSWTKEEKEEFATYPREAQEKIARREQDREAALRRGQNETAEQRKAVQAEREKVEQARQQYESALPVLLQTLQEQQQGEFSDIKTMSDIEKLAREDWPRYALWDAQQKKIAAVTQEIQAAQTRQTEEYKAKWVEFARDEDAKFLDRAPEMADKEMATKIADASVSLLKDVGFTEQELAKLWNGEASLSLRDHRAQLLIRDAVKYQQAKNEAPKKVAKPVPQVQRPGTAAPKGADADVREKNLAQKLEQSGNWKDAAALLIARRSRSQ